jgi:2-polyprenyl-6-methoxyphenol hydroxylase-like FAD-dependent oxidoreductase
MLITERRTKVLIVGAGPSGLMMAAQLLRYGIQPMIIDSKQGPTTHSKALGVQARSLEIYRQMGVVSKVVQNGRQAQGIDYHINGKQRATLEFGNAGQGQTPFPYILLYQQDKNERLLLGYLTQNCCPVYWETSLVNLAQGAGFWEAELQSNQSSHRLICDWVIGADGAHSMVRKQLDIPFNGDTYPHYFYLADVKLNAPFLNSNYVQLYLAKSEFCGFFPMPEKDYYRIIGSLPRRFENNEEVKLENILPDLDKIAGYQVQVEEIMDSTTYKLHHRMAASFSKGSSFLVGDAAHIHSPVGAQGMNTGLQDAYNLAWKLAGVIGGTLQESVLASYAEERMPVAKELLSTTDRMFNFVTSGNWLVGLAKKWVLPRLLKYLGSTAKAKAGFFSRVSQIAISYRESRINLHLSKGTWVKAGDRLPYLKVYDEKKETETDLHEWCSKPGFTLIVLGRFEEMYLFTLAKWITNKYPGVLNFFYLPPSGKNLEVFNAFQVDPHKQKAIIVRPDMYIGFLSDVVDIGMMDNYLQNVTGIIPK